MPNTIPDLWPANFGEVAELSPEAILKVQASHLAQKTKGAVVGEVKTLVENGWVVSNFNLLAPALNNYRYKLFSITHQFEPYPINFYAPRTEEPRTISDEAQLLGQLSEVLQAEFTARIISSLIEHSQS